MAGVSRPRRRVFLWLLVGLFIVLAVFDWTRPQSVLRSAFGGDSVPQPTTGEQIRDDVVSRLRRPR